MIDTVVIQPGADTGEPSVSGVSWPAVAAGAVVSCALTLVLLAFGIGLGLSVVSPWSGAGVSATTFKIGTGLYLIVVAMLSSSIGGYIAGLCQLAISCLIRVLRLQVFENVASLTQAQHDLPFLTTLGCGFGLREGGAGDAMALACDADRFTVRRCSFALVRDPLQNLPQSCFRCVRRGC